MEKIILKSTHPEEYPDLEIECRVIPKDQIGAYLKTIPVSNKVLVRRTKVLDLEYPKEGTIFKETLKTNYAGKEYLLTQSEKTIKNLPWCWAVRKERNYAFINMSISTIPFCPPVFNAPVIPVSLTVYFYHEIGTNEAYVSYYIYEIF